MECMEKSLELVKQLVIDFQTHEKNRLDIQIEALDRQIDEVVYELYGLTPEEQKIIEEATI